MNPYNKIHTSSFKGGVEGRLIVVKAKADDPVKQIYGALGNVQNTDDIMQELRGDL